STNCQYGESNTFKPNCNTCDDGCGRASQRSGCNFTHRTPCASGVVLCDIHEGNAQHDACGTSKAEPDPSWKCSCRDGSVICVLSNVEEEETTQEDAFNGQEACNEVTNSELVHGDYAWVTACSFVWLSYNRGAN